MAGLTQAVADLLYAALGHLHDDRYLQSVPQQDHGGLAGLADDDHSQYYNQTRGDARYLRAVPQQDHGGLAGLGDDDHTQYYNQARGDARYMQLGSVGLTLIEDKNLTTGAAASFDFQNIPNTYSHLKIELVGRSTYNGAYMNFFMKFNNDAGNKYIGMLQYGSGRAEQYTAGSPNTCGYANAATSTANYFDSYEITIPNYASTHHYPTWQCRGSQFLAASAGNMWIYDAMGKYLDLSGISRITLYPGLGSSWAQWSRATLYGMK